MGRVISDPVAFVKRSEERGCEWLAVIARVNGDKVEVLDVGVEMTERACRRWARLTLKRWSWLPGRERVPDAYDRAKERADA